MLFNVSLRASASIRAVFGSIHWYLCPRGNSCCTGNVCLFWDRTVEPLLPALAIGKWGSGYGFQPYGEAHKSARKGRGTETASLWPTLQEEEAG